MSGVSDEKLIYCSACHANTQHATSWDSEEPNVTWAQCLGCYPGRWISGYSMPVEIGKMTYYIMNRNTNVRPLEEESDLERDRR